MGLARYLSKLAALVGSDGKVPTAGIADGAITTAKVADSQVTAAKLHTTAVTDKLGYTPVSTDKISTYGDVKRFNSSGGYKFELGFISNGSNSNNYTYIHIKTNVQKLNIMVRFQYQGEGYSTSIIDSQMVVYTYQLQSTPYDPTYLRGGNNSTYGFVNCYYSTDGYLVLVVQFNANPYTGGWLSATSGGSHFTSDLNVLAYTHSNSTSGVY